MYRGTGTKYPLFLSDFNGARNFSTDFRKILKYKILWKPLQREPVDRQTDMTKLLVAFRNFSSAPKKADLSRYAMESKVQ